MKHQFFEKRNNRLAIAKGADPRGIKGKSRANSKILEGNALDLEN